MRREMRCLLKLRYYYYFEYQFPRYNLLLAYKAMGDHFLLRSIFRISLPDSNHALRHGAWLLFPSMVWKDAC